MFDEQYAIIDEAIVVPPKTARMRQETGVLTAEGDWVPECEMRRYGNLLTNPVEMPNETPLRYDGTWLWGGTLHAHFGHFMVESQSRIWRTADISHVDGILFVPKRPRHDGRLSTFQKAVFEAWGISVPVEVVRRPARVEELLVAPQSISLGERDDGTPLMRAAAKKRFGASVKPDGPERLYVSRSKLDPKAGTILVEPELERALADEGYEILHPQETTIETQIARYKAARKIVICDGSAAHLYAYCGRPDQDCAYLRRRSNRFHDLVTHIAGFTGRRPLELPLPEREWVASTEVLNRDASVSLHSMEGLRAALQAGGFISSTRWDQPAPSVIEARLQSYEAAGGLTQKPSS
ncbi:MAG: glycosyltransferase 61 family protein [Pseudomonadota bacterium]